MIDPVAARPGDDQTQKTQQGHAKRQQRHPREDRDHPPVLKHTPAPSQFCSAATVVCFEQRQRRSGKEGGKPAVSTISSVPRSRSHPGRAIYSTLQTVTATFLTPVAMFLGSTISSTPCSRVALT